MSGFLCQRGDPIGCLLSPHPARRILTKKPRINSYVSATAPALLSGEESMIAVSGPLKIPLFSAVARVALNTMRPDFIPGASFPAFQLPDDEGTPRRLSELRAMELLLALGERSRERLHQRDMLRFYDWRAVTHARACHQHVERGS